MILPCDSVAALCTVQNFMERNGLELPSIDFRPPMNRQINDYGYYFRDRKHVDVFALRCKMPSRSPYSWTWPGYTADLTVLGVTAHEVGHHVNQLLGWREVVRGLYDLSQKEAPIGGYAAMRPHEDFAETMRLFITNPSLLEALAPRRYCYVAGKLGLSPVETRDWREILSDSPRHIKAVENKL